MARKSFFVHSDFYDELRSLTVEQRSDIILALVNWADDSDEMEIDPVCAMLFRLMTSQMERISSANSANGAKGGRGRKSEKSEAKPKKPTVSLSVTNTITNTNKNTVDVSANASTAPPNRFVKPTVGDVAVYCRERNNQVDAQRFVDHYTSNGWRVGRNPMKDWRSAVRTWEKGDIKKPPQPYAYGEGGGDKDGDSL